MRRMLMVVCLLGACGKKDAPGPTKTPGLEQQPGETDLAAAGAEAYEGDYFEAQVPCTTLEVTIHPQGEEPRRYDLEPKAGKFEHTDQHGSLEGEIKVYHQDTCRVTIVVRTPDGNVFETVEAEAKNGAIHTVASKWGGGLAKILITPGSGPGQ